MAFGLGAIGAIASIGAKVAGTFLNAKGERQQGDASRASLAYRAAVLRNNAALADRAADDALARGKQAQTQIALEGRRTKGAQRVALAANGVVVDQGSALELTLDTDVQAQLDIMQTRENAIREAAGFQAQGENFRKQAGLLDQTEQSVDRATDTRVASTFLDGASSVAAKWQNFSSVGAFG